MRNTHVEASFYTGSSHVQFTLQWFTVHTGELFTVHCSSHVHSTQATLSSGIVPQGGRFWRHLLTLQFTPVIYNLLPTRRATLWSYAPRRPLLAASPDKAVGRKIFLLSSCSLSLFYSHCSYLAAYLFRCGRLSACCHSSRGGDYATVSTHALTLLQPLYPKSAAILRGGANSLSTLAQTFITLAHIQDAIAAALILPHQCCSLILSLTGFSHVCEDT